MKIFKLRFLISITVLWYYLMPIITLGQQYPLVQYTTRHGLAQMQCMQVFQDSRGFVWVSTWYGLSKFDGDKFVSFTQKDGLFETGKLGGMVETANGDLYIQNYLGLVKFDGQKFTQIPFPNDYKTDYARSIFINKNNKIIVKVYKIPEDYSRYTVLEYDVKKGFTNISFPLIKKGLNFFPTFYDKKTDGWYGFSNNINSKALQDLYYYNNKEFLNLFGTTNNRATINELTNGFLVINRSKINGIEEVYLEISSKKFKKWLNIPNNGQFEILFDPKKDILFHVNNNLFFYNAQNKKIEKLSDQYYHANYFIQDKNKYSYWVATQSGLLYLPNNGFRYFEEKEAPGVWSVAEGKNNNYWFLGFGSKLKKYKNGQISDETRHYKLFPFKIKRGGFANNNNADYYYFQPFTDKKGLTWFPNSSCLLNFDGEKFNLINKYAAFFLFNDEKENIIIQCSQDGIRVIENKVGFPILFLKGGKDIIDYPNYMFAFKDNKNRYWLGGWGGMNRFENIKDLKAKKSKEYSFKKGNIPFKGFITMCTDSRGTLWAGTNDGLYRFNEAKDEFIRVSENKFEGMMHSLIMIDDQHLLIGTNEGMYALDLNQYYKDGQILAKLYNHHNGFLGLEAGQNGTSKDSKGNIWLTSNTVLSYIEPGKLDLNINPLQPYIEQINKENVPWNQSNVFKIKDHSNDLFLKVGATGFNKSLSTQYSYYVEGWSDAWSDWQTSNEIALINLPNGTYNIKVKAKTEGILGDEPNIAKVLVHVNAYIWQTPNFYKYAALICLGLALLVFYFYINGIQSRIKLFEKQKQLNYLQVQTLQSQLNPHFLFNVLSSLRNLILKKNNVLAEQSLMKLSKLMRNYLDASVVSTASIENGEQNQISLKLEIDMLEDYLELEKIQYNNKFSYNLNLDKNINPESINIPPIIIQPFVENAIKHGIVNKVGLGNIEVNFKVENNDLVCTIEDDGIGRAAAAKIKEASSHSYKSHGTNLVEERVKLLNEMGNKISINTEDGTIAGTKVTIKINTQHEI